MKRPPFGYTRRLRPALERSGALATALSRPAGVLILPPALSGFQAWLNKVHTKAGPRR